MFNNPECILLLDVTQESFVDRTTSTLIEGAKGVDICAHLAQIGMCRDVCKSWIVHNNDLLPIRVKHNAPFFQQLSSSSGSAMFVMDARKVSSERYAQSVPDAHTVYWLQLCFFHEPETSSQHIPCRGKRYLFDCFGL